MDDEKHPLAADTSKSKLSRSTKILIGCAIIIPTCLFLISLGAIIGLSVKLVTVNRSASPADNVCMTPSCVELASTVLKTMNPSIDPCKDFYNYSCGGWEATNVIPSGNGVWGVFEQLDRSIHIAIKKILDGTKMNDVNAVELARQLYRSCMDTENITSQGAEPLLKLLNLTGGWDLIGLHNVSAPAWNISGPNFRLSKELGNTAFFSFYIGVNDKNSSEYIAQLQQSGLTLPSPDSYSDPKQVNETLPALRKYISSVLKLLGPSGDDSTYTQAANEIVQLETELASIFVSNVALRDPVATYNIYTLNGNLSNGTLWNQFNWTVYISELFQSAGVGSLPSDLVVIVRTPSYFTNLSEVYTKYNRSVFENYFQWQLVNQYISLLGDDFLDVYYAYTSVVLGSGKIERYLTCISALEAFVPMTISRLYTDYVLAPGTKGNVSEMVEEIKKAFQERLRTNTWLDNTTIQRSIWKVGNISEMIAYPDNIHNDTYLLEKSEAVIKSGGSYFGTAVWFTVLSNIENLNKLGKPVDKTGWEIAPTAVNAYYEPLYNEFVFLEGILNSPFFQSEWPSYFNYGAFGVVIGHELTHGFDDQGQRYNQDGILTPWWTNQSVKAFNERKACFVNQYSKYSVFGYHIKGNLTLGENIADNGGVKTAFKAYQNVIANNSPQMLPAIDLTPEQLFFVAFGQVWCSLFTPEFIASNLKYNPHSPGPYRVIGALSNSEEFAAAFKCPSNSPMNPPNKCDLW